MFAAFRNTTEPSWPPPTTTRPALPSSKMVVRLLSLRTSNVPSTVSLIVPTPLVASAAGSSGSAAADIHQRCQQDVEGCGLDPAEAMAGAALAESVLAAGGNPVDRLLCGLVPGIDAGAGGVLVRRAGRAPSGVLSLLGAGEPWCRRLAPAVAAGRRA